MSPHFLDSFAWVAERVTDILRKRFTTLAETLAQGKSVSVLGNATSSRDLLGFLALLDAQIQDPEGFRVLIAPTQTLAAEAASWLRWATRGLENAPEVVLQGSRQGFPKETAGKLIVMSARRFTCFETDGHFETASAKTVLFWDIETTVPPKTHKADLVALRHWLMEPKTGVARVHLCADKAALHLSRPIVEAPALSLASTFTTARREALPYDAQRALGVLGVEEDLAQLKASNTEDHCRFALADHFARADVKAWGRGEVLTMVGPTHHVIAFTQEPGAFDALERVLLMGVPENAESLLLLLTTLPTGIPVTLALEEGESDTAWDALCETLDVRAHWLGADGEVLPEYLGRGVRAKLSVKANYVPKPLSIHREDAIVFEDSDAPVRLRERLDTPESILPGRASRTTKRREDSTLTGRKAQRKPLKNKAGKSRARNGNVDDEAPRRRRKTEDGNDARTERRSSKKTERKGRSAKAERTDRTDSKARTPNRNARTTKKGNTQERRQPRRAQPDPLTSASAIGIYHESPTYPMGMTDSMLGGNTLRSNRKPNRTSGNRTPKHASAVDAYLNAMDTPMTLSLPQETPGLDFMGDKKRKSQAGKPTRDRRADGNRTAQTRAGKKPNPKRKPRKHIAEQGDEATRQENATLAQTSEPVTDNSTSKSERTRKKPFRQKGNAKRAGDNRRQNRREKAENRADTTPASTDGAVTPQTMDAQANPSAENVKETKPRRNKPARRPGKPFNNRKGKPRRTPSEAGDTPSVSASEAAPRAESVPPKAMSEGETTKPKAPKKGPKRRPMKPRRAQETGAKSEQSENGAKTPATEKPSNANNGAKSNPRRQGRGRFLRGRINAKHREKTDTPSEG